MISVLTHAIYHLLVPEAGCYGCTKMPGQEATQSERWVNIRRSERVLLRVPFLVRVQAENDASLSEESHTLVVNAHGALIGVAVKVQPGQELALKHRVGGGQQQCLWCTWARSRPTKPRLVSRSRTLHPTSGMSISRPAIGSRCRIEARDKALSPAC
jgi:hypothetical protein